MGLDVSAKGMPNYSLSYIHYGNFRAEIVRKVYGDRCYEIFTMSPWERSKLTAKEEQEMIDYWNSVCDENLDLFVLHSDCDGKFTPQECKRILKALDPIEVDYPGWDFDRIPCNMLDQWKTMLHHCVKRRVNLYFH